MLIWSCLKRITANPFKKVVLISSLNLETFDSFMGFWVVEVSYLKPQTDGGPQIWTNKADVLVFPEFVNNSRARSVVGCAIYSLPVNH